MTKNLGELLKIKRKEKGLSLEQVSKIIGVSKITYRDYELNIIKNPRIDKLYSISTFLEISPEEIVNLIVDKK